MTYITVLALKVHLFLWTLSLISVMCENTQENAPHTSVFLGVIKKYIKPLLQSLKLRTHDPIQKSLKETPVYKAISQKIAELKPLLQDDDDDDLDDLTLDGKEETTIIEFLPKNNSPKHFFREDTEKKTELFKKDIKKYKKIRKEIKRALDKESVSEKTKSLVTKTFDDILAQVISNQCTWRSGYRPENEATKSMEVDTLLRVLEVTATDWGRVKNKYTKELKNNDNKQPLALFDQFHDVLVRVINDTQSLLRHYKVNCQLVGLHEAKETKDFRAKRPKTNSNKHSCSNFRLCSEELKEFMVEFYESLNETAVEVFRNYAAMYGKDINKDEDREKDAVISVIYETSEMVEANVSDIFINDTKNMILDETKNLKVNIKKLKRYIRSTTNHVKKHIMKYLEGNLKSLRARLLLAVAQDLDVNLNVELGNLASEYAERICTVFDRCNGRYSSRRNIFDSGKKTNDANNIYVKVQISMDDDLKDAMVESQRTISGSRRNNKNTTIKRYYDAKFGIDVDKYINIHVTRTTLRDFNNENDVKTTPTILKNSDLKKNWKENINSAMVEREDVINNLI